jgi:hypothetical protein
LYDFHNYIMKIKSTHFLWIDKIIAGQNAQYKRTFRFV